MRREFVNSPAFDIETNDNSFSMKYPWLYKDETTLALPPITETLAIREKPANVGTWGYKNKNYIMYVPDGKDEPLCAVSFHENHIMYSVFDDGKRIC